MLKRLLDLLPPPPPGPPVPPDQVSSLYHYWRQRLLWSTYVGYAVYYCLRKNIPVAVPLLTEQLGISKTMFGAIFTLHDLTYGLAKFVSGLLADRMNPRILLPFGLIMAALANIAFGLGGTLTVLGIAWIANGFFQGFGFPPSARILSYWFRASERGVKWAIFNTSHQVGTFVILALSGYLGAHYGWRSCFLVPAALGLVTAAFLFDRVRDTPASLGLPSVEYYSPEVPEPEPEPVWRPDIEEPPRRPRPGGPIGAPLGPAPIGSVADTSQAEVNALIWRKVFLNPAIWLSCLGNFFVYTVRYGVLNWAPTFLTEVKHVTLTSAGLMTGSFELAGLVGCLTAGWLTDRYFQGRRAPVCVLSMLACAVFVFLFWKCPDGQMGLATFYMAGIGFTVYGPQFLGGVMAADLATKRAAGTAVGFHGFFGYLSGLLSGYGLGSLVSQFGWDGAYAMLLICAVLAVVPFVFIWNAGPAEEGS